MKLLIAVLICFSSLTYAQSRSSSGSGRGGGPISSIGETQRKRSSERFNILDWIRRNNEARAQQDAKYGTASFSKGPYPDLVLNYRNEPISLSRDGEKVGSFTRGVGKVQFLLDDVFTRGNKGRSLNVDLGAEVFYAQTKDYKAADGVNQDLVSQKELSGSFLIRPMGRSSQDSGLMVKVGYINFEETGFWANVSTARQLYGTLLGAEAKLYLLPFLGLKGDYQYVVESTQESLSGKWKMSRFNYGAYLEIFLLDLEVMMFTHDYFLTQDNGVVVKDVGSGVSFGASLYF